MGSPLQSDQAVSLPLEIGRGTILDRWRLPDGTLYLDNAATRPMLPEVAEEMARLMANNPLNASSQHKYGQKAARMLEDARNFFKSELNVPSTGELIFNSGATEGLNMLLKSAYFADPTKNHIVTVKTEHKAVLNTCAYLETIGAEVTYLDVDEWGQVSASDIEAAIRPTTCAVCVMWVNNETGLMMPLTEIASVCRSKGVVLLSDTTQGLRKHDLDFNRVGVDAVVGSAHKFGGPVGVGFVVVKSSDFVGCIQGGGQERGLRSGTQNVGGVGAMMKAWQSDSIAPSEDARKATLELRRVLEFQMRDFEFRGSPYIQLVKGSYDSIMNFGGGGYLVASRGSACNSGVSGPSHVMEAMGLDDEGFIRFSF